MKYPLSTFGRRLALQSGIGELMQDLGDALASGDENLCMLGGGQPAHIPEVDAIWHQRLSEIAADPERTAAFLGDYQPPAGDAAFRDSVARLFRREYGWPITRDHVVITAGGQTAFFLLLNALAGRFDDGRRKKVLLPLVPEYIGYADQSVTGDLFQATRPKIQRIGDHEFKYAIDFDALEIGPEVAAICLSRPTNPSSNVVSDTELRHLAELASEHGIPLLVDNAYGDPFPGVIFTDTSPQWNPSMVLTYSLSKLGLPGTRTGIVIADPEIVQCLAAMNSITALANNNIGQGIVKPLIASGELLNISREVIRPFYRERSDQVRRWLAATLDDTVPYRIHRSEGAFFLWLWLEGLPITSSELYQRLKRRGVLVVSGHYFFFGLEDDDWPHRHECVRISFTASEPVVRRGIEILADEVNQLYAHADQQVC
ncbi:valine--pyruvate transaminase [Roseiconus nitratireducens]|uniref:Valine--pyruvate transaminase n=1 Tax=Roseiconus nitratireducens TaxID=2605748 RepID=A0A5M6D8T3_9BACT|nr:valine--pyruvate transaminase [Roseiconus nitratireducens]KAA5542722.1 valine--pyruvate transaminase [Roseiconus nitratireducens]